MTHSRTTPLDEALAEQQIAALAFVTEAYAEAILAGIGSASFAHAALSAALRELVAIHGEDQVANFVERLPKRLRDGEYSGGGRH